MSTHGCGVGVYPLVHEAHEVHEAVAALPMVFSVAQAHVWRHATSTGPRHIAHDTKGTQTVDNKCFLDGTNSPWRTNRMFCHRMCWGNVRSVSSFGLIES